MMLPILISVSLAPESYFFCALAVVAISAAAANAATAAKWFGRTGIVLSRFFVICLEQVSQAARRLASAGLFRPAKRHCCPPPSVIDAGRHRYPTIIAGPRGLELNKRIGPRHRRLAEGGFRFARWLGAKTMGAAGFHQLGSEFADARIALVRNKLARGETVYLAGLGPP